MMKSMQASEFLLAKEEDMQLEVCTFTYTARQQLKGILKVYPEEGRFKISF